MGGKADIREVAGSSAGRLSCSASRHGGKNRFLPLLLLLLLVRLHIHHLLLLLLLFPLQLLASCHICPLRLHRCSIHIHSIRAIGSERGSMSSKCVGTRITLLLRHLILLRVGLSSSPLPTVRAAHRCSALLPRHLCCSAARSCTLLVALCTRRDQRWRSNHSRIALRVASLPRSSVLAGNAGDNRGRVALHFSLALDSRPESRNAEKQMGRIVKMSDRDGGRTET